MPLTKPQTEAAHLLFDSDHTDKDVAAKIGVDPRTLRRWRQLPEFAALLEELQADLNQRARKHILATKEGRIAGKLKRHRHLSRHFDENAEPATAYADKRIELAISRELSRLEAEISQELGQHNVAIAPDEEPEQEEDLTCLSPDELDILELINNKIAAANPWLQTVVNRPLTDYDLKHGEQMVNNYKADISPGRQN